MKMKKVSVKITKRRKFFFLFYFAFLFGPSFHNLIQTRTTGPSSFLPQQDLPEFTCNIGDHVTVFASIPYVWAASQQGKPLVNWVRKLFLFVLFFDLVFSFSFFLVDFHFQFLSLFLSIFGSCSLFLF